MSRSGLYVVPDPRRPFRLHPDDVREVYRLGGLSALADEVRVLLWLRVRGRATSPAEYAALVAWLALETDDQTAYLAEVIARPKAPEVAVAAPDDAAEPGSLICAQCGDPFTAAQTTGRRRVKCWKCSPPRR